MKKLNYIYNKIQENKFLIIGRAGIDIYPDPPGTKTEDAKKFIAHLGGSSANISVALTKLGAKCKLLTRVSDDALGRLSINELKKYNVNTSLINIQKGEARISFAIVETTIKDHQSIIYRNGAADLFINNDDIDNIDFNQYSTLIFTGTALAAEPSRSAIFHSLKKANDAEIPIVLDIDYRPYTWESSKIASEVYLKAAKLSNIVIGNDDEFGIMANSYNRGLEFARSLNDEIEIVIYKIGDRGSVTFYENKELIKGIFHVKALKPTGAGDAFIGGLIGGILNGKTIEDAIEFGSASAAIVVTKVGCAPAMPNTNQIQEFIKVNKISK